MHNGSIRFVPLLFALILSLACLSSPVAAAEQKAAEQQQVIHQRRMVGEIQDRVLEPEDYSPTHTFAIPVSP